MESEGIDLKLNKNNKNEDNSVLPKKSKIILNKKLEDVGSLKEGKEQPVLDDILFKISNDIKYKTKLNLHIELDIISIGLFLLALITRVYNLGEPKHIVFDELHYGRYVTLYTKGIFFFDAHPPLGKQLLYLAGHFGGYNGNFTFDRIGSPYTDNVPIQAMRLVPAVAGSLLIPLAYHIMREISTSQWTAILAAVLILLENSLLVQSRFMLLECIQLAFGLAGVLCALRSVKSQGITAGIWLSVASIWLGCCFSVKYSGFYTYFLTLFLIGRQIWGWIGQPGLRTGLQLTLSAIWRFTILLIIPFSIYIGVFYVHLAWLPKAGPHDSVMTSAFQASLEGGLASITKGQPVHVAHGSQITLRHTHGRTCWLHSHAHVYPVRYADGRGSSHQQQVTCYSFKDVNNWWIVKREGVSSLAVSSPPDVIRHGDEVQLLHGITSRALNSHDVAAAVSPQTQEVSCYIDYNVSMPAQNLWRVDIVSGAGDGGTWDSIRSQVRLQHVSTGAWLRYSGRQLPAWGFHQHEVVGDRATHTEWNVEEHRYTKAEDRLQREKELVSAEMIPTRATHLTFWDKFLELQYKMLFVSTNPTPHMFSSEPADWPLLARSVAYWLCAHSNAQIHLIGNLVTWYSGSLAVVIHMTLLAATAIYRRRNPNSTVPQIDTFLLLAYLSHYLPHFFMERTLFLHHYLPAYMFKILLLAYVCELIYTFIQMSPKIRKLTHIFLFSLFVWLTYVARTYKKFSVLNYGTTNLNESDLIELRWKETWDFILHKRV